MVLDLAGRTAQKTGLKLYHHEYLFGHVVFAADAVARGRQKPENTPAFALTSARITMCPVIRARRQGPAWRAAEPAAHGR